MKSSSSLTKKPLTVLDYDLISSDEDDDDDDFFTSSKKPKPLPSKKTTDHLHAPNQLYIVKPILAVKLEETRPTTTEVIAKTTNQQTKLSHSQNSHRRDLLFYEQCLPNPNDAPLLPSLEKSPTTRSPIMSQKKARTVSALLLHPQTRQLFSQHILLIQSFFSTFVLHLKNQSFLDDAKASPIRAAFTKIFCSGLDTASHHAIFWWYGPPSLGKKYSLEWLWNDHFETKPIVWSLSHVSPWSIENIVVSWRRILTDAKMLQKSGNPFEKQTRRTILSPIIFDDIDRVFALNFSNQNSTAHQHLYNALVELLLEINAESPYLIVYLLTNSKSSPHMREMSRRLAMYNSFDGNNTSANHILKFLPPTMIHWQDYFSYDLLNPVSFSENLFPSLLKRECSNLYEFLSSSHYSLESKLKKIKLTVMDAFHHHPLSHISIKSVFISLDASLLIETDTSTNSKNCPNNQSSTLHVTTAQYSANIFSLIDPRAFLCLVLHPHFYGISLSLYETICKTIFEKYELKSFIHQLIANYDLRLGVGRKQMDVECFLLLSKDKSLASSSTLPLIYDSKNPHITLSQRTWCLKILKRMLDALSHVSLRQHSQLKRLMQDFFKLYYLTSYKIYSAAEGPLYRSSSVTERDPTTQTSGIIGWQ